MEPKLYTGEPTSATRRKEQQERNNKIDLSRKPLDGNGFSIWKGNVKTEWSRFVQIQAEVEKIWALYDMDDNGTLDYDEIKMYLQE